MRRTPSKPGHTRWVALATVTVSLSLGAAACADSSDEIAAPVGTQRTEPSVAATEPSVASTVPATDVVETSPVIEVITTPTDVTVPASVPVTDLGPTGSDPVFTVDDVLALGGTVNSSTVDVLCPGMVAGVHVSNVDASWNATVFDSQEAAQQSLDGWFAAVRSANDQRVVCPDAQGSETYLSGPTSVIENADGTWATRFLINNSSLPAGTEDHKVDATTGICANVVFEWYGSGVDPGLCS